MTKEDLSAYPQEIISLANNAKHIGRLNDPSASAYVKGPCGDEMEFYLVITNNKIEEARFFANGCVATLVCGETTAAFVEGRTLDEALAISPKQVKDRLPGLPVDHSHCSILAVTTLFRAIADYLLKP